MDKLKKVFSPGSSKDDEILYGDAEQRRASAAAQHQGSEPQKLHATEGSDSKKEGGVLRQVLNPGGDKYDDQRFGTTATTAEPTVDPSKLSTTEDGQKDHTITQQILNPNREKYDEQRFGTTATTTDAPIGHAPPPIIDPNAQLQTDSGKKDHSILRQILNPHGDKYDDQGFGQTAHVTGQVPSGTASTGTIATGAADSSIIPDRTAQTTTSAPHLGATDTTGAAATDAFLGHGTSGQDSHLGRDAAIAGGLGAAGAGAYGIGSDPVDPSASQENTSVLDRPHPLGGQSNPHDHINPISAPEDPAANPAANVQGISHSGRDAGVAAGLVGAGAVSQLNQAPSDVQSATYTDRQYNIPGDNCDGRPTEGYIHHTHGPHSTDIANKLDPHLSGESPTEAGATSGLGGVTTVPIRDSAVGGLAPTQLDKDHHYARDATLAGGVGAAGYGAHEATQDTGPASKTIGPHESNIANIADPRVQPDPELMKGSQTAGDHHPPRDAALVGAAGTGGAAYAADQAYDEKHERKLQKEREKEAEKHAKEAEKEQKPSLIHRILHPGEGKEKEKESHDEDRGRHSSDKHSHDIGSSSQHADDGHNKLHKKALGEGKTTEEAAHHHEAVAGPDWNAIEKANTPH